MAHIITCRICKKKFDTEKEPFVLVGQKAYYHKNCFDEWKHSKDKATAKNTDENFWYEAMVDFLYRDIKLGDMNFVKIQSQWKSFIKKGYTPKGIYFAIRYFYEVARGDSGKSLGGIGIVPSIYNQAAEYWVSIENQKAGTLEAIIAQIDARKNREVKIIEQKAQKKKDKARWSLDDI